MGRFGAIAVTGDRPEKEARDLVDIIMHFGHLRDQYYCHNSPVWSATHWYITAARLRFWYPRHCYSAFWIVVAGDTDTAHGSGVFEDCAGIPGFLWAASQKQLPRG